MQTSKTKKKLTYSIAHPEVCNIQELYDLCLRAAYALSNTISETDLLDQVDSFYYSQDLTQKIMLLALDQGKPIAVLGAIRVPSHFIYADSLAVEQVLWVDEEYRKTKAMHRLIKAYEKWATQTGATHVILADVHNNEKLQQVYIRKGYNKVETAYMKELN